MEAHGGRGGIVIEIFCMALNHCLFMYLFVFLFIQLSTYLINSFYYIFIHSFIDMLSLMTMIGYYAIQLCYFNCRGCVVSNEVGS
jgi:hypothetical protein